MKVSPIIQCFMVEVFFKQDNICSKGTLKGAKILVIKTLVIMTLVLKTLYVIMKDPRWTW